MSPRQSIGTGRDFDSIADLGGEDGVAQGAVAIATGTVQLIDDGVHQDDGGWGVEIIRLGAIRIPWSLRKGRWFLLVIEDAVEGFIETEVEGRPG